jgi:hypothetical protein
MRPLSRPTRTARATRSSTVCDGTASLMTVEGDGARAAGTWRDQRQECRPATQQNLGGACCGVGNGQAPRLWPPGSSERMLLLHSVTCVCCAVRLDGVAPCGGHAHKRSGAVSDTRPTRYDVSPSDVVYGSRPIADTTHTLGRCYRGPRIRHHQHRQLITRPRQ